MIIHPIPPPNEQEGGDERPQDQDQLNLVDESPLSQTNLATSSLGQDINALWRVMS